MDVSEQDFQPLYTWVDSIPLSRPKRNIARDFSDGVLMAEIVHRHFPRLVQLHNYSAAHSLAQKMYNWSTLNQKVFRRLGFVVAKSECEAVCNCHPGAVERVLKLVRIQLANYAAKQASRSSRSEDDESKCGDETAASEADTTESQPHSPEASAEDPDPAEQQGSQSKSDRAAQQSILHLRETNGILETKVRKLEQLVKLKDIKLQALTAKLQRAGLGDK